MPKITIKIPAGWRVHSLLNPPISKLPIRSTFLIKQILQKQALIISTSSYFLLSQVFL